MDVTAARNSVVLDKFRGIIFQIDLESMITTIEMKITLKGRYRDACKQHSHLRNRRRGIELLN